MVHHKQVGNALSCKGICTSGCYYSCQTYAGMAVITRPAAGWSSRYYSADVLHGGEHRPLSSCNDTLDRCMSCCKLHAQTCQQTTTEHMHSYHCSLLALTDLGLCGSGSSLHSSSGSLPLLLLVSCLCLLEQGFSGLQQGCCHLAMLQPQAGCNLIHTYLRGQLPGLHCLPLHCHCFWLMRKHLLNSSKIGVSQLLLAGVRQEKPVLCLIKLPD